MRFVNAIVHVLDRNGSVAKAIACQDGRIAATGSGAQVAKFGGDEVDLRGRVVLPGFTDAHGHLLTLAQALRTVDLAGARSEPEAVERVRQFAAGHPRLPWITGRGWDQTGWPGAGFPAAATLSAAVPDRPVSLGRVDGHALWVNGAALALAGIDAQSPDPDGGRIVRDAAGNSTGILLDAAMGLVRRVVPAEQDEPDLEALAEAAALCSRAGLTGVHEMGSDARGIAALRALVEAERLPLRMRVAIGGAGRTWNAWRDRGPERRYRDRLSIAALKLFADGALGSRGAALLEPYSDDPDNRGLELASGEDLERWTRDAIDEGFQVCTHAIGDRANRTVLDAYERATEGMVSAGLRLRIEHAQVLSEQDLPRFRRLGVIASMQPSHCASDSRWATARLGPERSQRAYAWRSLLDAGTVIAGGSDFPVEPPDPLAGIVAAVSRRASAATPAWQPEQRLATAEAVRAFTSWAAYAGFDEDVSGSLDAGKFADFVVLSGDPYHCDEAELRDLRVLMTVSGGEIVYSADGAW